MSKWLAKFLDKSSVIRSTATATCCYTAQGDTKARRSHGSRSKVRGQIAHVGIERSVRQPLGEKL